MRSKIILSSVAAAALGAAVLGGSGTAFASTGEPATHTVAVQQHDHNMNMRHRTFHRHSSEWYRIHNHRFWRSHSRAFWREWDRHLMR